MVDCKRVGKLSYNGVLTGDRTFPLALNPVSHTVTPFWPSNCVRSKLVTEPSNTTK